MRLPSTVSTSPGGKFRSPGVASLGLAEPYAPLEPGEVPVPHIIAWNLTRRCNLACAHCYISAGSWHAAAGELDTSTALRLLDGILAVNSSPVLILSGGEPLLREDLELLAERAAGGGATVVVGTNGTRLTDARISSLMDAGVQGVAVSVDSLDARYHDRFRNAAATAGLRGARAGGDRSVTGAPARKSESSPVPAEGPSSDVHGASSLEATLAAVDRCRSHGLDFIIQTTVTKANRDELPDMMRWAADAGAVAFNVYFLVATGRGAEMRGMAPEENDSVLADLVAAESEYRGRMMVRSKCQPQIMRHALEADTESALLNYATRCPCGVHYCRITPEGKLTPCPYTPVVAGDLLETSFEEIWRSSAVLRALRSGALEGKCGDCRYREVCGGCRARAFAETGNLLGPDESCAYTPAGPEEALQPRRGVTYGAAATLTLRWTDGARGRLDGIPSFVRGVVASRVESFARERGYEVVDEEVMAEVRTSLPVDFSKRLPFFLRKGADA